MARRHRLFAPGLHYHVIARGNHRERIFLEEADYRAYLSRLATYRERYDLAIYAYCLMPNHVHLVVQTHHANLAKFMQGLQVSFVRRFNRINDQVGHLFQGRYTALVCQTDEYLATLVRYVHLNPVRASMVGRPEAYPYSGHRAYLSERSGSLVDPGPVLRLLGGRSAYRRFVDAGVPHDEGAERYLEMDDEPPGQAPTMSDPSQAVPRGHPFGAARPDLRTALARLASDVGFDLRVLEGPDRSHPVAAGRTAIAYVLVRRFGYPLAEVARVLGRAPATLSSVLSRSAARPRSDGLFAVALARLTPKCQESQCLTPRRRRQRA